MAPAKKPVRRLPAARCEPFRTWALPTAYDEDGQVRMGRGFKRCKPTRRYKIRKDPRKEFPRLREFQARFRLPPHMVECLTEEFSNGPFCPTMNTDSEQGLPIPIFNKVSHTTDISRYK